MTDTNSPSLPYTEPTLIYAHLPTEATVRVDGPEGLYAHCFYVIPDPDATFTTPETSRLTAWIGLQDAKRKGETEGFVRPLAMLTKLRRRHPEFAIGKRWVAVVPVPNSPARYLLTDSLEKMLTRLNQL